MDRQEPKKVKRNMTDKEMEQATAVANRINELFLKEFAQTDALILVAGLTVLQAFIKRKAGISVTAEVQHVPGTSVFKRKRPN